MLGSPGMDLHREVRGISQHSENKGRSISMFHGDTNLLLLITAALVILAAWSSSRKKYVFMLAGLMTTIGVVSGLISPLGLLWIATLTLLAGLIIYGVPRTRMAASMTAVIFGVIALPVGFGVLPGLESAIVIGPEVIKDGSESFTHIVNPGLVVITLLLLALHPLAQNLREAWSAIRTGFFVGLATVSPVFLTGLLMGGLALQPGYPSEVTMVVWMLGQVLTIAMEEGFFRGFLQRSLSSILPVWAAIGIAGVLFGLAHFAGGAAWIVAASVAGIGYGVAYNLSGGRLEASMSAHLTVNLVCIGLCSYPNIYLSSS